MKERTESRAGFVRAVFFCIIFVLVAGSGFAQSEVEKTAGAAVLQDTAPAPAEQESTAAFDEAIATANATAAPQGSTELAEEENPAQAEPGKPSYGNFLARQEKPNSSNIMDTGDALISSVFSTAAYLCLILGIIFLAFWLLRKFGPRGIAGGSEMINPQLVGRLALGQKRHLDVVRVQGRTLLLGVTEENVRLLTELDTRPGQCFDEEDEDEFTDFTEMLGKQTDSTDAD